MAVLEAKIIRAVPCDRCPELIALDDAAVIEGVARKRFIQQRGDLNANPAGALG